MKTEEIIKELEEILGTCSIAYVKNNVRKLIEKLQPKPLFVPGPAKYADGTDCNILAIHTDDVEGMITEYKNCGKWLSRWHRLDGRYSGDSRKNVMPNNESEEK